MSKTKNFLKFLSNPRLFILLYLVVSSVALLWFGTKYIKKLANVLVLKQTTKANKPEQKLSEKISLNEGDYSSADYSINTNDEEKTITTAGIICILPNGNILHFIMTGENINGRMNDTEETINFLTKHQNEIFDDMARTIVEAGQKSSPLEPKKERPIQNESDTPIKKKV